MPYCGQGGGALYTSTAVVEVVPRTCPNCKEEVPVLYNGVEVFVDPISYMIKTAGSPVHCNDIAPPRYKLAGKWYCSHPELRECHDLEPVVIHDMKVTDIDSGWSIYTEKKMAESLAIQDSQGTRNAFLAEATERAYGGQVGPGNWGHRLSQSAHDCLYRSDWRPADPLVWLLWAFHIM